MSSRLNYYFRQKVTEAELDSGFTLLEDADQAQMTDLGLVGVISGMVVTERGAGANLTVDVSAGKAYDKDGLRIAFTSTQNVDVSVDEAAVTTTVATPGNSKILSVFAKFARILSDPRTDGNSVTVYFSEAEGFAFIVRQGSEAVSPSSVALDGSFILLADITRVQGDTTITNAKIDTTATNRREEAFKASGSPHRIQRGTPKLAVYDLLGWLNTEIADRIAAVAASDASIANHIADATDAHDASAVSFVGGGAGFADTSTLAAIEVNAALNELVATLGAAGGAAKIGGAANAASYVFGTAGGTAQALIDAVVDYLDLGTSGRRVESYVAAASPVTLAAQRQVAADTTAGAITLTLPAPSHGREFYVKDSANAGSWGTNNLTLAPNGAEKIEGVAASRVFAADFGSFRVWSDGTDWFLG